MRAQNNIDHPRSPLNVIISVDVELWPEHWDLGQIEFNRCFNKFIHGKTTSGDYGLGFQLKQLKEHNLKCVFFVESLFSGHYGTGPLQEIVAQIQEAGQEVQLHLHTEWLGRGRFDNPLNKTGYNLFNFNQAEQQLLICRGKEFLVQAGADNLLAFRAGNFGSNLQTLEAVAQAGFIFDSSINPRFYIKNGLDTSLHVEEYKEGIYEFPLTIFKEWGGRLSQFQFGGSCSFKEMATLLKQAWINKWHSVVILSHGSELLNRAKTRPDRIVVDRFVQTCQFLANNRDLFETIWFSDIEPRNIYAKSKEGCVLQSGLLNTAHRYLEQTTRRFYG